MNELVESSELHILRIDDWRIILFCGNTIAMTDKIVIGRVVTLSDLMSSPDIVIWTVRNTYTHPLPLSLSLSLSFSYSIYLSISLSFSVFAYLFIRPTEDIFILDTYTQLFLWIGEGSTEDEKVKGARFAKQFIADVSIIRNTRQTLRTELFRSQDFLVTVSPFVHIQIVLILSFAFSYVAQCPFLNYIFTCKFTSARIFLNLSLIFSS